MITDFTQTRPLFDLPEGVIYLDGNSLGPLPRAAARRVADCVTKEWGQMLITGWNRAGWMEMPTRLGTRIGRLIGAAPGTVTLGDTLSIKVYQALASCLEMNPGRRVILSDTGNFPSDLYMAQGLCRTLGPDYRLVTVAPGDVAGAIDDSIAEFGAAFQTGEQVAFGAGHEGLKIQCRDLVEQGRGEVAFGKGGDDHDNGLADIFLKLAKADRCGQRRAGRNEIGRAHV